MIGCQFHAKVKEWLQLGYFSDPILPFEPPNIAVLVVCGDDVAVMDDPGEKASISPPITQ